MAAMALGLWVMVLYSGLVEGMLVDMVGNITDTELGEIQIVAAGYRDDPSLYATLEDPDALLAALDQAGLPSSARLVSGGLAAAGTASAGVSLVGLEVARDRAVSDLYARVARGDWLDPADPRGVVLGSRLARTLQAAPGDELLVLSQGTDGSIANELYTVRGVLSSVGAVDQAGVLMNSAAFRELLVLPEGAHQILVRVPQGRDLLVARAEVAALAPGQDVQTWKELMPLVAQWLESTRGIVSIMYVVMYFAIAILVLNAMLMAVFERIREFGVMKAIGYSPAMVFGLITLECVVQVAISTGVALVLALPAMAYLQTVGLNVGVLAGMNLMGMSMVESWRGHYGVSTVVAPVVVLWGMVIGAALLPALRAARISPVAAMRHR